MQAIITATVNNIVSFVFKNILCTNTIIFLALGDLTVDIVAYKFA